MTIPEDVEAALEYEKGVGATTEHYPMTARAARLAEEVNRLEKDNGALRVCWNNSLKESDKRDAALRAEVERLRLPEAARD